MTLRAALPCFMVISSLCGLHTVQATPTDFESLVNNSPFGAAATNTPAVRAAIPLEFRATLVEGQDILFSMFDASSHHSLWVRLNESGNSFKVLSYDPRKESLRVDYQGQQLTLVMKKAAAVIAGQAGPVLSLPADDQTQANPELNTAPYVPKPDPVLISLAQDIRRRRAMNAAARK